MNRYPEYHQNHKNHVTLLKMTSSVQQGILSLSAVLKIPSWDGEYQLLGSPQLYCRAVYVLLTGLAANGSLLLTRCAHDGATKQPSDTHLNEASN